MKRYLVIYKAPADAMPPAGTVSKEEAEAGMKEWMLWAEKCGDNLVDLGSPLQNGLNILPGGVSGESKTQAAGYSILQAESMDQAKALLDNHPHLGWNSACEIELHEALPMPGSESL